MADHLRHAAGQAKYEVREVSEGNRPLDRGVRYTSTSYPAAVDYAFEFLQARDPHREGKISGLEIVKVDGARSETVWTYSHSREQQTRKDPFGVWGFDVTRHWHGPPASTRPLPRRRLTRRL